MNSKTRDGNKSEKKNWNKKPQILYVSIILLLVCALVSFVLWDNEPGSTIQNVIIVLKNFAVPAAISILCSVIASIICAGHAKRETEDSINKITKNVTEIYSGITEMMPSRYYTSSDTPNPDFNQYLNRKILESRKYRFYGESARYTCKRLLTLPTNDVKNLEVEVYLVDPTAKEGIQNSLAFLRDKDRNRNSDNEKYENKTDEKLIEDEKLKTLACLYILGKMRVKFEDLRIYLLKHVPTMTIEMTDDSTVLEFFRTRNNHSHYPLTLIYDNKPTIYECYDFILDWEKHNLSELGNNSLNIGELVKLGKRAGLEKIDANDIELYAKNEIIKDTN